MRLLITGPTRAGKTTAIRRILDAAAREPWLRAVILDGKGELAATPGSWPWAQVIGPDLCRWEQTLSELADALPGRYQALLARGLRHAAPGELRVLLVVDEVQITRASKTSRNALLRLFEQSGALGDILIIATQRAECAVSPSIRINCDSRLHLITSGFFLYTSSSGIRSLGRVVPNAPLPDLLLSTETLPAILGNPNPEHRPQITLLIGAPGLGKTHALRQHQGVYCDLAFPHREALGEILRQCGLQPPTRASISHLADLAAIAVRDRTLLLDNAHLASPKQIETLARIARAAAETFIATNNETPRDRRIVEYLMPMSRVVELQRLTRDEARRLALTHLPASIPDRERLAARIADQANGNPRQIVALAERVQSGATVEVRGLQVPRRYVNLAWIPLAALMATVVVARWWIGLDAIGLTLMLFLLALLLRPIFYRSLRSKD